MYQLYSLHCSSCSGLVKCAIRNIYKVSPKRNYNGDYIFSTGHSRVIVEHDHFGAYILYTIYHYHYHCNYDQDKMTIYHHYTY